MRISDCSSDVCSSDLQRRRWRGRGARALALPVRSSMEAVILEQIVQRRPADPEQLGGVRDIALGARQCVADRLPVGTLARGLEVDRGLVGGRVEIDRQSVVEGTSVSVRVDLGGARILKTKKKQNKTK